MSEQHLLWQILAAANKWADSFADMLGNRADYLQSKGMSEMSQSRIFGRRGEKLNFQARFHFAFPHSEMLYLYDLDIGQNAVDFVSRVSAQSVSTAERLEYDIFTFQAASYEEAVSALKHAHDIVIQDMIDNVDNDWLPHF